MFGSYIKNLNDLVFSTSDSPSPSPEEQPNTSVLGRLGSWLWSRSSISSTDASSPTSPGRPAPPEDKYASAEDVFYPVSQQDEEETPDDEWEEASSSFHSSHPQPGKKIHVYLEETSVSAGAGQKVAYKYSKSLQVRPKSRSSVSLDSEKGQSFSTELVGVNLNSQTEDNPDVGVEMGRRNARRRQRKNSHGDSAESSSTATKANKDLADKAEGHKSTAAGSAPKTAQPELQKSGSSGSSDLKCGQDNSSSACAEAEAAEVKEVTQGKEVKDSSMEDDSFYQVERKTETPESKRRSMKVSKSEVKLFTKNVPLEQRKSDLRLVVTREEEAREEATGDARLKDPKKPEVKPKPAVGRLADKISLFEKRNPGGPRLTDCPRSADVSPIRKPTGRLKAELTLSEQRSRSAECLDTKRSSSASPPRKGMTIKERVKNLNLNDGGLTSSKTNVSRVHHRVTASKSLECLDSPDRTDGDEISKSASQLNGTDLKAESPELTKKGEADTKDANDSSTTTRTGSRNKKRRSKEPASPIVEKGQESTKQHLDSVDGKLVNQEEIATIAVQVADSVLKNSQKTISDSSNVKDATTTKKEEEKIAKNQSSSKISEKNPSENTKEIKLDAKGDVSVSIGQKRADKSAIIDVKPVKPTREDTGNKLDSSKVTSSSKTVATPEVKLGKSQVELSEKVSAGKETSNNQRDLHNKEGNAPTNTQEKAEAQKSKETSFTNGSKVLTVKQEKSIAQPVIPQADSTQQAEASEKTTGNEQKLPKEKQAASKAIDQTESHSAERLMVPKKVEETVAQETPRESKQDSPSGKLENAASSGEQRPSDKLKGTTESVDIESSNEVLKSLSLQQIEARDKLESSTKSRDRISPNEMHSSVPSNENNVRLASVHQDVSTSAHREWNSKIGTETADKSKLSEQTKESIGGNKATLSNVKTESVPASEVQKSIVKKDSKTTEKPDKSKENAAIQESSSQLEKDVARQDVTEKNTAHLSVSKHETDPSGRSDQTKTPFDTSPAVLPPKDQEIAGQNSAPFTRQTDGLVKEEKERLAALDIPATRTGNANKSKAGLETKSLTSELQVKEDAKLAGTGLPKAGVVEKGGKLVKDKEAGEIGTFGKQVLDDGKAKLDQKAGVASPDIKNLVELAAGKQEKASKNSPHNIAPAEESVGAENNAFSVKDNEAEREARTHTNSSPASALTKSPKIHGKEIEPKSAVAPKPQAESVTAEKSSQDGPDDSALQSRPITANQGTKNDISAQKDVGKGEKAMGAGKISPEHPAVAKDLIRQAGGEFEKAITNIVSGKMGPANEQTANGDVSGAALKDEAVSANKQSSETLPKAKKFLDSSRKRHNLAKGRSKDDWSLGQSHDAPSSWLNVDFPKQKLKVPNELKLTYSGSESNLLDSAADLDDQDFVEKIKKLCAPFQLPPRKHNYLRHPQPPFAMPAIKEDRFEKTFDPEEFTFGLRKNKKFSLETPSLLAKLQSGDGKTSIKPARASLADRSMLLSGLEARFRDKGEQEEAKGEAKEEIKVKSRLEGSCVLNSLTTSSFRSKLSQSQAQAESTEAGNVSPRNSPQQQSPQQPGPPPLVPASPDPETRHTEEEAQELLVTDSGPPAPAFSRIKLPGFLEKYLPRETPAEAQSRAGREQPVSAEAGSTMPSVTEETQKDTVDMKVDTQVGLKQPTVEESVQDSPKELHNDSQVAVKMPAVTSPTVEVITRTEEQKRPEIVTNHFAGISLKDKAPPPGTHLKRRPSKKIRAAKGFHKRPGKMLLFEKAAFEGQMYEVHRDMEDASSLLMSNLISVRVVRGCWVLYEKPGFQGRTIALEEGNLELNNVWAEPGPDPDTPSDTPMQIGSIRLAVADYSVPHIDLFTEPEGRGRVTQYHDDALETGSFGIPLSTASIQVHSGVWLVFSDPGYQGMLAVLETGVYPFPETWGFPSPFVGSLRPLKMGGFKVENPNEVKAVLFEKAGFEGPSLDVEADVFSFGEEEGDDVSPDSSKLQSVGSLKVHGGLWVGYSEPGFEGQQYVLEEGEYLSPGDWGGADILSIRPIMADFMSPHMKMFSDRDFGKLGVNIDLTVPVINLDDTGYGLKTQSMDVLSGVWVVFEELGFCGESYIVEKGQYGSPEDWGGTRPSIASAMPVLLENFENTAKFKVQLFSEADFRGSSLILEDSEGSLTNGFSVASCKVLAGSWLAFEGQDFSGRMYVLDEGTYPDLRAMGCAHNDAAISSLQVVGFEFSAPSIVLFERSGLKGKRVVLSGGVVNLQTSGGGGRVQSVMVEGGVWVLYEEINFRGAQVLLRPGEVSDWRSFCHWKKIGSLRPLLQKQVHFHLRNRLSGQLMTLTGDLDDIKLMRVQEMEDTHGFEQIWFFQHGHLRCKLLEECCLCPSSSVTIAGARVGVTPTLDEVSHLWSITPEGFISYSGANGLVLDIKGGHNYDKSQVVLNTRDPMKRQQQWLVEVL